MSLFIMCIRVVYAIFMQFLHLSQSLLSAASVQNSVLQRNHLNGI